MILFILSRSTTHYALVPEEKVKDFNLEEIHNSVIRRDNFHNERIKKAYILFERFLHGDLREYVNPPLPITFNELCAIRSNIEH